MHRTDSLNEEQREAVTASEPYVLVSAGPGTGKTHTLVHRIAHLIRNESVPADDIVVLTFTRKAAKELKARLDLLSEEGSTNLTGVWAGTIHARCAYLLRTKQTGREQDGEFTILDLDDQAELFSRVLEDLGLRGRSYRPESLLRKISAVKNGEVPETLPDEWEALFEGYRKALEKWNALDYDDLQLRALERCEEEGTPIRLLVDEFQDLNPLQHRLIRRWVGQRGTLFAIGDADQSVYGFRGASVEHFLQFESTYPEARLLQLDTNYRSGRTIVRSAGKVIACNRLRIPQKLTAHRKTDGIVRRVELGDERAEAEFVTREIEGLLGGTHSLAVQRLAGKAPDEAEECHFGDIAVLFRTHALARDVRESLERAGFPVKESAREPWSRDPLCKAACGLTQFLINPGDTRALGSWIRYRTGLSQGDTAVGNGAPKEEGNREREKIPGWWERVPRGEFPDEDTARLAASFETDPLDEFFARVERTACADGTRRTSTPWNLFRERAALFQSGVARRTAPEFLEQVMLKNPSEHYDDRASAISLLTLHAAKGLEFPVVFLIGAEDGLLPLREGEGPVDLEEERRLFYVGMTRARRRLTVTHCRTRFRHGRKSDQRPSPFWNEMDAEGIRTERGGSGRKPPKPKQKTLW